MLSSLLVVLSTFTAIIIVIVLFLENKRNGDSKEYQTLLYFSLIFFINTTMHICILVWAVNGILIKNARLINRESQSTISDERSPRH
ncbi:hypothetical protein AB6A40_006062 [Gnathostoma spinigerum]|uniref:Uncharacterized protein n=1 Tax=Gnathostoma spinigerum TaxID=75299 RepID=A0ABD6EHG7_9BILA